MNYPKLEYKGYVASLYYSEACDYYIGSIANSNDCILCEGDTLEEFEQNFLQAVDAYLESCKNLGRKPR